MKKKLRLCFIANLSDSHARKWIRYFAERDYDVHWISLPSEYKREMESYENLKIYILNDFKIKIFNILMNIKRVRKFLHEIRPHVLHIHYLGVNGALGVLSGFHPFLATAHGSDVLITKNRPLIKLILKKSDLITCDAEHFRKTMERLGANPSKIKIIYFGVDTQIFSPGEKDKELIKKLDIFDSPVIISLRNLEPIYDLESLIRAVPLVIKKFPEAIFLIAGRGSEAKRLKGLTRALGIFKNVKFLGLISDHEIPKYLRTSDVYVSTSLSDAGIASSTAEAMACGLPVVITDFGENSEWIKDGENGFLVPLKNPQAIAEKIIILLKDSEKRFKFGEISRKLILEKNNYQKEMEKMEKIYEEVVKSN